MPGNELAAGLQGALGCAFDATATRNLHANDGYALDIILCNDTGQLFGIVSLVQLGTADQRDAITDELVMEIAVGVGGTVSSDEQIGTVKIGSVNGHELDLAGPLGKLTRHALWLAYCCGCVVISCIKRRGASITSVCLFGRIVYYVIRSAAA